MRVAFCGLALLIGSCSNNKLYPVSGKVTYKGSSAPGAVVSFHRQGGEAGKEPLILGIVQEDGSFELMCGYLGKGAPPGHYHVLIEWKRLLGPCTCAGGPASIQEKRRHQSGPDVLQGRYADPKNPRFQVTIKAERNELPLFELTD